MVKAAAAGSILSFHSLRVNSFKEYADNLVI